MINCNFNNYTGTITNPCNNEEIQFNLKLKECYTDNFDRLFLKINGIGTGTSGNKYVYSTNLNQNIKNVDFNTQEVVKFSLEIKENIIGIGDAPDFKMRIRYHFTMTPNGDITVDYEIIDIKCS